MIRLNLNRVVLVCSLLIFAGCAAPSGNVKKSVQAPVSPVTCIGVLPAVPGIDLERKITDQEQKDLAQGAKIMNRYLTQEFSGQDDIVLVDENYLSGIKMTGGEKPVDIARLVGENIHCNAILETKILRYTERVGNTWSVEEPASVAFEFRLFGTDQGNILWAVKFDEKQIPVLDNIYNWSKAKTRGFTWIKADELMLEGMREKLSASPYFNKIMSTGSHQDSSGDYDENI